MVSAGETARGAGSASAKEPGSSGQSAPLNYIERIREYYLALGYAEPYRWAHFHEVPFSPLARPLAEATIAIVTTAAPYQPGRGEQGPGAAYNGAAKFYQVYSAATATEPDLRIAHVGYDRVHTTAEDQGSYFPLRALKKLERNGVIGGLAARFHGLPSNRSQRRTIEVDCVELVARCREDGVDGAILVANCPVCHQSVSLAARALEAAGIASVIMGCARDIVEYIGVPRLLFNNFPLGNAAGPPNDAAAQLRIAELALGLLQNADTPRSTLRSPFEWPGAADWQRDYANAAILSADQIRRRRAEFDRGKAEARKVRDASG